MGRLRRTQHLKVYEYHNEPKKLITTFYVCSYGGCGSTMLCKYLSNFGKVKHIHSRHPPQKLTRVGENIYFEWFNTIEIPEHELSNYKVIFLYRNPVKAILSRFHNTKHLRHIQCEENITISDVISSKKDLYGVEEFFDNYINNNQKNYKTYCVKYEDFWDNISTFNEKLGIPDNKDLYPVKVETEKDDSDETTVLYEIYDSMIQKMETMPFIYISE
jgi:hypothetical protein